MRIGVVSDAHGNLAALDAALDAMGPVDRLLFAGDLLGYYFDPAGTLRRLRERDAVCVLGNHDTYFLAHLGLPHPPARIPTTDAYRARYGPALQIARDTLTADEIAWLAALPPERRVPAGDIDILLTHGSPWSPVEEYVYPDHVAFARFAELDADLVVMGHTHYPLLRREGRVTLLNPGSCGQPRDRDPRACFAVVEVSGKELACRLGRVAYPRRPLVARCAELAPDVPLLAELLVRGAPLEDA